MLKVLKEIQIKLYVVRARLDDVLADKFGIANRGNVYIKPKCIYTELVDCDEDRIIEYKKVDGVQLFPINKNFLKDTSFMLGGTNEYINNIIKHIK